MPVRVVMDDCCYVCDKNNLERYVEIAGRRWLGNEYDMDGYYRVCFKCAEDASVLLEIARWVTHPNLERYV